MKTPQEFLKGMTNQELKKEYVSLRQADGNKGCFGRKDLIWLEMLEREIDRRGMKIITKIEVE